MKQNEVVGSYDVWFAYRQALAHIKMNAVPTAVRVYVEQGLPSDVARLWALTCERYLKDYKTTFTEVVLEDLLLASAEAPAYVIKLDCDTYAGMDDEAASAVLRVTDGECHAEKRDYGYDLVASNKNALAAAYIHICGVHTLKEAMEQGDPSYDLSTDEGVWKEFAEYYRVTYKKH